SRGVEGSGPSLVTPSQDSWCRSWRPCRPVSNCGLHVVPGRTAAPTQAVLAWPPRRPCSPGPHAGRARLAPTQAGLAWPLRQPGSPGAHAGQPRVAAEQPVTNRLVPAGSTERAPEAGEAVADL